jgi:hypothetical protein
MMAAGGRGCPSGGAPWRQPVMAFLLFACGLTLCEQLADLGNVAETAAAGLDVEPEAEWDLGRGQQ